MGRISDCDNIDIKGETPFCMTGNFLRYRKILDRGEGAIYKYRMVIHIDKFDKNETGIFPIVTVYFNDDMGCELCAAFALAGLEDFHNFKKRDGVLLDTENGYERMVLTRTHNNNKYAGFIDYINKYWWLENDDPNKKGTPVVKDIYEISITKGEYLS